MSVCVRCVTMPDRPHSVPGIRSFDAELTDRLSQLQQQEGRAYAEEHLYPPAANRSESHTQLAKLLQKCRKGEDGWPIAVISPAPLRATPSISQLPFWKSSVNFYPCASPAADAVSADSTAVNESEGEDAEVGLDAMEAQAKGTIAGNEVLKINCKQLNELAERIQQIAAWNNLSVQLTFSQLQTITPPSTPDPVHTQSNALQLRIPSRQHSYDDADDFPVLELREQQEGHHKHFVSEAEEAEYDVDVDVAQCMPRAATPTVQIPAEISPTSSSGLASDPVSPSSSASRTPSTSLSFRAAASVVDHYAQLSSNFRQSLQDSEQCIPLLLEEIERQRLESVENQKRNEETIEALKQEVERLKAENDRLRNEKCVTEQSI